MFDIGWSEIALVAVLALVVIGPKDLPKVLRTLGRWVRRLRLMGAEMQRQVDDLMRDSGLDEVRDQVRQVTPHGMARRLDDLIDPDGEVGATFRQRPADLITQAPAGPGPASTGEGARETSPTPAPVSLSKPVPSKPDFSKPDLSKANTGPGSAGEGSDPAGQGSAPTGSAR
ncbi:Sec-independent protein translocase protein TatB [Pararhodospirillum oryzae]|uniref:Sec-independent protein translocase protein TatB n=1 Tax=Pararhodospirillum oryzae TaxID=478448 RepID=A0A512HBF3_9PROT|nr:Sec-independent protein translocase protein TatB [Pararhodospirillum oryzae]GEO82783.1 Sec-independent protein translocase protein TatB [Pararhodospirillum oryzae]